MEDRIIELEKKFSYQEDMIDTLNTIITQQQDQIDALEQLIYKVQEGMGDDGTVENTPPPHY
ncbi:MAG: SlyX family protein [Fibrobacterales bacterium]